MTKENNFGDDDSLRMRTQCFAFAIVIFLSVTAGVLLTAGDLWKTNDAVQIEISGRINPNQASAESLVRLPGIGPSKAESIISYRNENGSFRSAGDLENISGIGPATVKKIEPYLSFDEAE